MFIPDPDPNFVNSISRIPDLDPRSGSEFFSIPDPRSGYKYAKLELILLVEGALEL